MVVRLVLWNLTDSLTTTGGLRGYLVEVFDLEATMSVAPELARLGLAFESGRS
jgi:hypothetical protein